MSGEHRHDAGKEACEYCQCRIKILRALGFNIDAAAESSGMVRASIDTDQAAVMLHALSSIGADIAAFFPPPIRGHLMVDFMNTFGSYYEANIKEREAQERDQQLQHPAGHA